MTVVGLPHASHLARTFTVAPPYMPPLVPEVTTSPDGWKKVSMSDPFVRSRRRWGAHCPARARRSGLSFDLGSAADRVWYAAALFKAGKASWVLVSGGNQPGAC